MVTNSAPAPAAPAMSAAGLPANVEDPRPPRRVLGMSAVDLVKYILAAAIAVGGAYVGIRLAVQDNAVALIEARASIDANGEKIERLDERLQDMRNQAVATDVRQAMILSRIDEIRDDLRAAMRAE